MRAWILAMALAYPASQPPQAPVRSVFLNGIDISSARSQELKNVDIVINEQGDLFISAPHYQVNEEDTYVPLSKYVQGANAPVHQAPQAVGAEGVGGDPLAHPANVAPLPKAGTPVDAKDVAPSAAGEESAMPKAAPEASAAPVPGAEKEASKVPPGDNPVAKTEAESSATP
jgi:hypothetical protein